MQVRTYVVVQGINKKSKDNDIWVQWANMFHAAACYMDEAPPSLQASV